MKYQINHEMTQSQFAAYAERFLEARVMPLLKKKGEEYSNGRAFVNFEQGAQLHDMTPGSYLMVMATKHWHNLCKKPDGEQEQRIVDIIVYMLLLQAMHDQHPGPWLRKNTTASVRTVEVSPQDQMAASMMKRGNTEPGPDYIDKED